MSNYDMYADLKVYMHNNPEFVNWCKNELNQFHAYIEVMPTADMDMHFIMDKFREPLRQAWYDYIHNQLNKYGFVNGEPKENTYEKRPKAAFWFDVFKTHIDEYHANSITLKRVIMSTFDRLFAILNERKEI